jgi:magnesium chelatase family protein
MALFRTRSAAVFGIEAHLIDVEVDMYPGGSARDFITVGMPDTAVRESRERIKSAMLNSGFGYPNKSVTINLAPANVRKEGAGFDLPMALGILGAMGTVGQPDKHMDEYMLVGELSLDGTLRPVRGVLSIAVCARRQGIPNLLVPADNAAEAAVTEACACSACGISRKWWRISINRTGSSPRHRRRHRSLRPKSAFRIFARFADRPQPSAHSR